jgi:hypothetical protein
VECRCCGNQRVLFQDEINIILAQTLLQLHQRLEAIEFYKGENFPLHE